LIEQKGQVLLAERQEFCGQRRDAPFFQMGMLTSHIPAGYFRVVPLGVYTQFGGYSLLIFIHLTDDMTPRIKSITLVWSNIKI